MINRGEIWWAGLDLPRGSEPGYRRPVLIIQANEFNASRINTVIVLAITSNTALAMAPGNVLLRPRQSGLGKISVINVSQVITINKNFLIEKVKRLPEEVMKHVDSGIKVTLAM